MAKRVYCTYFDHNYLSRGLALYHSLQRHAPGSRLWVLCLSEACHQTLVALDLPELVPVRLADFEAADPEVAATRAQPQHHRVLLHMYAGLDAFCAGARSGRRVGDLSRRRFVFLRVARDHLSRNWRTLPSPSFPTVIRPSLQGFENSGPIMWDGWEPATMPDGIAVIRWWRERCIEWCHDVVDGDRFADQGYLDSFPRLFPRVRDHREHRSKPRALEYRQLPDRFSRQPGADRCRSPAGVFSIFRA